MFKDGHPFAAIEKSEKIFVGTYFEKTDEMGLSVIDKGKGNLRKIKLNNKNAIFFMKLISLGDKVIVYGDDAVMNRDDKKTLNTSITAVDFQGPQRPAHHPGRAPAAPHLPGRAAPVGQRGARRDEPGRPAPGQAITI